ncbi:MAG TPA: glycoside hydrolase family 11 protein [Chitinispirillaceae bacterium]|nr:glycoside hydrolase family 11 protein [Chitinispirillaceae bacterium]
MSILHHVLHFRCITIAALTLTFLNVMNAGAQDTTEVITFPYVINNENSRGPMPNGYHYEMWKQDPGTVKMTVPNDEAKFDVEWRNIQNFVARVGLVYDETKTHEQIGTFTADLEFQKSSIQNGLAYFGIYGWTVEPLVEYYIMEDWVSWRPRGGDGSGHQSKGTITVDGAQYDVVTRQMNNQPSIKGTASFPQVFSIRQNTRSSGSISISEHFKQWEKLGIKFGNLYEVKIKVESYNGQSQSTGSCKVTKGVIKVDGLIPTAIMPFRGQIADKRPNLTDFTTHGAYTLISLNGQKIRSIACDPSQPLVFSKNNFAPGIYLMQSKVNGATLNTRPLLVK